MRINDIIVEFGLVKGIDTVNQTYAQNYRRGYDSVDRILNPNSWRRQGQQQIAAKNINNTQLKFALETVINGQRLYLKDQQALLQASKMIKQGQMSTDLDSDHLSLILKSAANGQQMNSSQLSFLSKFKQEL